MSSGQSMLKRPAHHVSVSGSGIESRPKRVCTSFSKQHDIVTQVVGIEGRQREIVQQIRDLKREEEDMKCRWRKLVEQRDYDVKRSPLLKQYLAVFLSLTRRREISEEFLAYCQALCIDVCRNIYAALPRELRDMVYSYLSPDPFRQRVGCSYSGERNLGLTYFGKTGNIPLDSPSHRQQWREEFPYWHNRHFVGTKFAREIVEHRYRNTVFDLVGADGLSILGSFLTSDIWEIGIQPSTFIRRIHLRFLPVFALGNGNTMAPLPTATGDAEVEITLRTYAEPTDPPYYGLLLLLDNLAHHVCAMKDVGLRPRIIWEEEEDTRTLDVFGGSYEEAQERMKSWREEDAKWEERRKQGRRGT